MTVFSGCRYCRLVHLCFSGMQLGGHGRRREHVTSCEFGMISSSLPSLDEIAPAPCLLYEVPGGGGGVDKSFCQAEDACEGCKPPPPLQNTDEDRDVTCQLCLLKIYQALFASCIE